MPTDKAAQILREGRGHQWEPTIVDAFLSYLEKEHPQARLSSTATAANTSSIAKVLAEPAIM